MVFKVEWRDGGGGKQAGFVSWVGGASAGGGGSAELEVPAELGACLGMKEGQEVKVKALKKIKRAVTVNVTPLTEDDWEIVELYPVRAALPGGCSCSLSDTPGY